MSQENQDVEGAACPLDESTDKKTQWGQAAPTTSTTPRFLNPDEPIHKSRNKLPHWQQDGATYFFTWRLADSIPAELRRQWVIDRVDWLREHPKPWSEEDEQEYHRRFSTQMERWLDAGYGSCVLRQAACRSIVGENLCFFDGQRYTHHVWVIMPNHAHSLTSLRPGWNMEQVVNTWKSYTGLHINRLLGQRGELWQEDYYNRLIRDAAHFDRVARYIQRNPVKASLREDEFAMYVHPDCKRYEF